MHHNYFKTLAALALCAGAVTACSDDNDNDKDTDLVVTDGGLQITVTNIDNWMKYAGQVATLLHNDAESLLKSWEESYEGGQAFADLFKNHNNSSYGSAESCIEEIIEGCANIANEVGETKIGDPVDLLTAGRTHEALYAVESWFSWHSREDYANNILSVRNSLYGSLDGSVNANSIIAYTESKNAELASTVKEQIAAAHDAILAIPQPFRNNINSSEALAAMQACSQLEQTLTQKLKPMFETVDAADEAKLSAIVNVYVDDVVLPTYRDLEAKTLALLNAVKTLVANPTNANMEAACAAWLAARTPWEKSEAFLFGPVDALGLDPNMDSWPLDEVAIANHVTSGNLDDIVWGDGDDDDVVEAAQNVRGFHTLEFLLFYDGKARKLVND